MSALVNPQLQTNLKLGPILFHQEVQLEVMEIIQVGFMITVHKKQRFVDKLPKDVFHVLRFQIPEDRQNLADSYIIIKGNDDDDYGI